jgi:ATP-dependent helicase/nuclease subunit B
MSTAAIQQVALTHGRVAEVAARAIIAHHGLQPASLRDAIVLIPDLHAVPDMARALRAAVQSPVLLLPRITTLRAWAGSVVLDQSVLGGAARELLLYRALVVRRWFAEQDLWTVCGELAALFDELTRERVALPPSPQDFAAVLARAYGGNMGRGGAGFTTSLDFEARLVHDLWQAFTRAGGALDAESAYVARLAQLAQMATAPLYLIGAQHFSQAEREFFERYAARAPVTRLSSDTPATAQAQTLLAAWPEGAHVNLRQRARELHAVWPESALDGHLCIAAAASVESHAQMIDCAVRERLAAGRRHIAVVVFDRLAARRARALLERAGVLVEDEAGWALSTVSAATVIGRWLDVASGGAHHADLFDLLKSPFAFHDWPAHERAAVVQRFEQHVRQANIAAGLDNFIALAERHGDAPARQMLVCLQRGARLLERRRATIAQWLGLLEQSLTEIGVCGDAGGLQHDAAGEQLLDLLARLQIELAGDTLAIPFAEWRRWLARAFESATFRDRSLDSPVVFTFLAATPLREFDAVIIAGADAAHLPGSDAGALFFNQRVRAELGLRTRSAQVQEMQQQLRALMLDCDDVLVTWQRAHEGEDILLSPFFERLNALHLLAYGASLEEPGLATRAALAVVAPEVTANLPAATAPPAPVSYKYLILNNISASGYNALMACPYQYYARHLLRLAELDDVQELIDKADYGNAVHAALTTFHRAHPQVSRIDPEEAVRALEAFTDEAFRAAIEANYLARAWLARFKPLIPQYLAWQRERETEGWRFRTGEAKKLLEITTPQGRQLTLHGRIDRVDENAAGSVSVIDYKTQRRDALRSKLEVPGEDVQLPVYALLWGGPVAAALFLSLEREGVREVAVGGDINALAEDARARLAMLHDAMYAGAALPAQGVDQVCQYCEMDGLCRRSQWP